MNGSQEHRAERSFAHHIRSAIAQNKARLPLYLHRGGMRAWGVMVLLIWAERIAARIAARWDREAAALGVEATRHLTGALVPMSAAPRIDHPLPDLRRPEASVRRLIRPELATLADAGVTQQSAQQAKTLWRHLRALEAEHQFRIALSLHIVESFGAFARQAQSGRDPALGALLHKVQRAHLRILPRALWLDQLAWPVQARGVGLLINDLPAIGFPEEGD